jgi:hypothetical protein
MIMGGDAVKRVMTPACIERPSQEGVTRFAAFAA